jgi:hypothetical protein
LVDRIVPDDIKQPLQAEDDDDDIEFDGVEDIKGLNGEVYKRRIINALMDGVANFYVSNLKLFLYPIYELNPQLPEIYRKIQAINSVLIFYEDANVYNEKGMTQGSVSEVIIKQNDRSTISVKGINFIAMLYE